MPQSQYARDQALQYAYTATVLTRPTVWYASLHTGFPGDTGTSILNEFTSGADTSYARVQLVSGNALAITSHLIQNGGSVTFGPAGGTWATATYLGICDASTAGNLWAYMELSQSGATFFLASAQFANPGSAYLVNDALTLASGGGAIVTVDTITTVGGVAGIPTSVHVSTHGSLSSIPANPMTTTGGAGTGATMLAAWLTGPQAFQLNNGDSMTLATAAIQLAMA